MIPWNLGPITGSIPAFPAKTYYITFPFQTVLTQSLHFVYLCRSFFLASVVVFINLSVFPSLRSARVHLSAACSQRKGGSGKQARISRGLMRQTAFTQVKELGVELPTLGG